MMIDEKKICVFVHILAVIAGRVLTRLKVTQYLFHNYGINFKPNQNVAYA
jgi:hypothetical protein